MGGNRCTTNSITSDNLRPIPGCPHYLACDDGRIFSLYTMQWVKPHVCKQTGYAQVSICENGIKGCKSVHRLVAEAFIEKPDGKDVVNHKNEVKTDNRASNLEWVTTAENLRYGTAKQRAVETVGIEALRKSMDHARSVRVERSKRPVTCIETCATYPSIADAAESTGLRRTGIWAACNGKQKTCGGYSWAYEDEVA